MNHRNTLPALLLGALTLAGCGSTNAGKLYAQRLDATQAKLAADQPAQALPQAEALVADTLGQRDKYPLQHFYALVLAADASFDAAASKAFFTDPIRRDRRSAEMAHAVSGVLWVEQAREAAGRLASQAGAGQTPDDLPASLLFGLRADDPVQGALTVLELRALAAEARFGFAGSVGERLKRVLPEAARDGLDVEALATKLSGDFGLTSVEQFWVLYGLQVWSRQIPVPTNRFRLGHWAYFLGRYTLDPEATSDEYRAALEVYDWLESPLRDFDFVGPEDDSEPKYDNDPLEASTGKIGSRYCDFIARKKAPVPNS